LPLLERHLGQRHPNPILFLLLLLLLLLLLPLRRLPLLLFHWLLVGR
jgi:hypothetical protein